MEMQFTFSKENFIDGFPILAVKELETFGFFFNTELYKFIKPDKKSFKFRSVHPMELLDWFELIGYDISIYRQFETWRYDIHPSRNSYEPTESDMFIDSREECVNRAIIQVLKIRQKQLENLSCKVSYITGLVELDFEGNQKKAFVSNEEYLSVVGKGLPFLIDTLPIKMYHTKQYLRIQIENFQHNFNENFQAPVQNAIKVTIFVYLDNYGDTLEFEPWYFKL